MTARITVNDTKIATAIFSPCESLLLPWMMLPPAGPFVGRP